MSKNINAAASLTQGQFEGIVDGHICGWALPVASSAKPAIIKISIDGIAVARLEARAYREDLVRQGHPVSYCGFKYPISKIPALVRSKLMDGMEHSVSVTFDETENNLKGSPKNVVFGLFDWANSSAPPEVQSTLRKIYGDASKFLALKNNQKPVAIVSTFTEGNRYLAYHSELFKALKDQGYFVLAVHTSGTADFFKPQGFRPKADFCGPDLVIVRTNVAYDFGSYMYGLNALIFHGLENREVLLTNDSSFGPIFPLEDTFDRMRKRDVDFWGLIDSYEHRYHIQSFFICLNPSVMRSEELKAYVRKYKYPSDKRLVIEYGELGFTPFLFRAGFEGAIAFPYDEALWKWTQKAETLIDQENSAFFKQAMNAIQSGVAVNPTHFFADILLEEFKFPFVKKELLFRNPIEHSGVKNILQSLVDYGYSIEMIKEAATQSSHQVKVWPVNALTQKANKISASSKAVKSENESHASIGSTINVLIDNASRPDFANNADKEVGLPIAIGQPNASIDIQNSSIAVKKSAPKNPQRRLTIKSSAEKQAAEGEVVAAAALNLAKVSRSRKVSKNTVVETTEKNELSNSSWSHGVEESIDALSVSFKKPGVKKINKAKKLAPTY